MVHATLDELKWWNKSAPKFHFIDELPADYYNGLGKMAPPQNAVVFADHCL